ncbi:alpha-methylacyl-CoA racemase [Azotobacter beijerinckii]|uniref:Alpha-methylacyl-CoA racemase n=1 Tax=Azotobacter beijerinckii TaxID=170623 RepID=A0A1H6UJE1_9GAMM|nr:CaiB/BaiF CoA-transferase family protein [Azotobacter beijerinckii]SEI89877.1 alpha-methylacyl-CoA racemase [Azotobacter beijerinckii]
MSVETPCQGPLVGLRVLEFAGIGPGPHCAMMLADMGAEVLRIDREGGNGWPNPVVDRGRSVMVLDIRSEAGWARCLELADQADVLIEGYRPGVMERLGLGPEVLHARNPRLVYGRMTGWGQGGPLARTAGHDINYIALTGALAAIGGRNNTATPPLNLVGDFGGGSLYLAFGILAALWERERSGLGQVVDAAIIDGVSSLMSFFAGGNLPLARGRNLLGGAAPYYRCYRCADGREIAVGPIEPQFYAELLERIEAPADLRNGREDPANWEAQGKRLAELFASRTQAEWCTLLEGSDACFAPVLELDKAPEHPHMKARGVYQELEGRLQVSPAPRLSRTPGKARTSIKLAADAPGWREVQPNCSA